MTPTLACCDSPGAQNWHQSSARFLSEIRIRESIGPTGQAAKRARPVEVVDVFEIRVWRSGGIRPESSGFVSTTAHPLVDRGRVIGSISFCFTDRQHFEDRTRTLLVTAARVVAEAAVAARKEP